MEANSEVGESMERIKGTVVWFNNAKGFGFLKHAGGEVFVHYSAIESEGYKSLKEGDEVEFSAVRGSTGKLQADKVVRVKEARDIGTVTYL